MSKIGLLFCVNDMDDIEVFVEYLWLEKGFSDNMQQSYCCDLCYLVRFLVVDKCLLIVKVLLEDLQDYLVYCDKNGLLVCLIQCVISVMCYFYCYCVIMWFCEDNLVL